jgi:hypothetical protein
VIVRDEQLIGYIARGDAGPLDRAAQLDALLARVTGDARICVGVPAAHHGRLRASSCCSPMRSRSSICRSAISTG